MTSRAFRILGLRLCRVEAEEAGVAQAVIEDLSQGGLLVKGDPVPLKIRALRVVMALLDGALLVGGVARLGISVPQSLLAQIDDAELRQQLLDRDLISQRRRNVSSTELPALTGFEDRAETLAGTGPSRIAAGSGSTERVSRQVMRESSGLLRVPNGARENSGLLRPPRESSGLLRAPNGVRESSGLLRPPRESSGLLRDPTARESSGLLRLPDTDTDRRSRTQSGVFAIVSDSETDMDRDKTGKRRTIEDTRRLLSEIGQDLDGEE